MLKILVVEDDRQLATTLKFLIEDNPRYRVVATTDDAETAVAAAERHRPHLALVDLHLARGSTGFSVAVRLGDFDVPCLFVSGKAPSFAMPDLALGCLMKPVTAEDVHRALALAEDKLRGREALRMRIPRNLKVYDEPEHTVEVRGFIPSRPSLRTRLGHWIAAHQRT
ncbi:MAG TPA: response regulator [Sphingomicrobium sp.]|nr:response regulator [Sphingomicrobium sp.]